jgi:hypothetical protein
MHARALAQTWKSNGAPSIQVPVAPGVADYPDSGTRVVGTMCGRACLSSTPSGRSRPGQAGWVGTFESEGIGRAVCLPRRECGARIKS